MPSLHSLIFVHVLFQLSGCPNQFFFSFCQKLPVDCRKCLALQAQVDLTTRELEFYRNRNSELAQQLAEARAELKARPTKSLLSPSKIDLLSKFNDNVSKVPGVIVEELLCQNVSLSVD